MKRNGMKIVVALLVLVFTVSFFGGCSPDEQTEQVDSTRTQLYVATFGGGIGTVWLDELKKRFEEDYKDESFETGKQGVQVLYIKDEDKYTAAGIKNEIQHDSNEVLFLSGDQYDEFLLNNSLLDITDVVTETLSTFGESRSIENKLSQEDIDYFRRSGKYYALPHGDTLLSLMYDVDLFQEKRLYFAKNGAPSETEPKFKNGVKIEPEERGEFTEYDYTGTGEKSAGPDGEYGTYDDGLPATIEEFEVLLAEMKSLSIDPLIYTGMYAATYSNFLIRSMWASYHGIEEANIPMTGGGSGTSTRIITGFDRDGNPQIENVNITKDNYTQLSKQAGYYYGLKLWEILIQGNYVSKYSFQDLSHVVTQNQYLVSSRRQGEKPIAMIVEGTWWENEADVAGTFKDNIDEFGPDAARSKRRFGVFPMPKATVEQIGSRSTFVSSYGNTVINANIAPEKIAVAKLFLQYSYTDASLCQYTVSTGFPLSFNYDLPQSDFDKLSYFSKQLYELYQNSDMTRDNVVMPAVRQDILALYTKVRSIKALDADNRQMDLFVTGAKYSGYTAREYFEGLYRYSNS